MEKASQKRTRRKNIQNILLQTVGAVGVLSIALVAPKVIVAIQKMEITTTTRQKESIERARKRLVEKGLLKYHSGQLVLTKSGVRALQRIESARTFEEKPRRWDKKWRVLIFDIPEKKRRVRDIVRTTLRNAGFLHIQDSVWIYPYDCEDAIALLKADLSIGREMLYMIVDSMELDAPYRKHFLLH